VCAKKFVTYQLRCVALSPAFMAATLTETITLPSSGLRHRPPSASRTKTNQQSTIVTFEPHPPGQVGGAGGGGGSSRRHQSKVVRIHPALVFQPTRKKLSTLEAQRIMSTVVEMIRRVEIAALLPSITERLDNLRVCLGSELVQRLEEHAVILGSYAELQTASERGWKTSDRRGELASAASRGSSGKMVG